MKLLLLSEFIGNRHFVELLALPIIWTTLNNVMPLMHTITLQSRECVIGITCNAFHHYIA